MWPQVQLWCSALFNIRNSRLLLSQHATQLPVQTRVISHNLQSTAIAGATLSSFEKLSRTQFFREHLHLLSPPLLLIALFTQALHS